MRGCSFVLFIDYLLLAPSTNFNIQKEINLVIISAFCSMLQNQAALKRAKFANFKTNHKISYTWENNLVFDLLAKKRNLKIGHVIKFW